MELIISKIDGNLGLVIPAGLLARHQLKTGDKLYCPEVSGEGRNSSSDDDLAECMEIVERIMREDHEVLRRLAE
jgi:hypothetical protein